MIFVDDLPIPQYDGNMSLESSETESGDENVSQNVSKTIPVIVTSSRLPKPNVTRGLPANVNIKHFSKKVLTATQLPVIVNLNPRSVYNKKEEFKTMVDQLEVDVCFMSESWDRKNNGLENIIQMDGYQIIKNVLQRPGKGGKPALIISSQVGTTFPASTPPFRCWTPAFQCHIIA